MKSDEKGASEELCLAIHSEATNRSGYGLSTNREVLADSIVT